MQKLIQTVTFTVTTDRIRGQARPRFSRWGTYKDAAAKAWESAIRDAFLAQGGADRASFADEVHVTVRTSRRLPSGRPKRVQSEVDLFKPDIDNVLKAVLDALNGTAYKDDKQVTLLVGEKLPRERRESELLEVTVEYFVTVTEREITCQTYTS